MRQTFDHIADPAGTFEVYRPRHLVVADKGLVRSMSGYVERAALPSTRIERATGDVILIFEISAPIALHTRAGLRHSTRVVLSPGSTRCRPRPRWA